MALSKLLAGLRATRLGAVAAAAALATTSVVATAAVLPDEAAPEAHEAVSQADEEPADTDLDNGENGDNGEDNGRSADVHAVLGGGEYTPDDGDLFGQAVAEQAREQEDGSFGRAVAEAARGGEADDDENGDDQGPPSDVPPVDLPPQAERRGGNTDSDDS